jgi:CheY-like chemotaxis protein
MQPPAQQADEQKATQTAYSNNASKQWLQSVGVAESESTYSSSSSSEGARRYNPKLKVLLVEDHPLVQKVHRLMLEMVGCRVDVASSGQQALTMYVNGYDIILLDVGLPDISGLGVSKTIRSQENEKGCRTPIVVLTAFSYDEINSQCIAAGVDEVAVKPVKFEDLQGILERHKQR